MRLITNKSKNLLYRILPFVNCTIQFATSYAVATQISADTDTNLICKCQYRKGATYIDAVFSSSIPKPEKIIKTFTTPENLDNLDYDNIVFGVNGKYRDTLVSFPIKLKPSTTYTFTCNFTNITQGSISWKDMMLVEGSTAGDYEPYSYNLLDKWRFRATSTSNGITWTNNGDGSVTANGYATGFSATQLTTEKFDWTHKFLFAPNLIDKVNADTEWILVGSSGVIKSFETILLPSIIDPSSYSGITSNYINIKRYNNSTTGIYTEIYAKPALYDLTLMYGEGKEPTTVDQFYTDHPELKVSPLGFIGLKNLEISNKNIKRLKYQTGVKKNLFDINKFVGKFVNTGRGIVENNTIYSYNYPVSVSNTECLNIFKSLTPDTNYTISAICGNYLGYATNSIVLYFKDTTEQYKYIFSNYSDDGGYASNTFSLTSDQISKLTSIYFYGRTKVIGGPSYWKNIQLELGSTATSYVDYNGCTDLGIIPSNSGYILNEYNNLTEEILEENIEKDNISYHIPDKTNILLNKIEGKTNKIVQILDRTIYPATTTISGVTYTNNSNGTVNINGTATEDFTLVINRFTTEINHKYLLYGTSDGSTSTYFLGLGSSDYADTGSGVIRTYTQSLSQNIFIRVKSGVAVSNITIYPQFFDLTAMYGYGKEPTTVEQFKKDYPQFFDEKLDGIWNVRTSGISTTGKNLFDISKWIYLHYDVANGTLVERLSNGAICQGNNGTGDGDNRYSNGWFRPMYYQYPNSIYLQAGTYTLSADYTMIENSVVNTARVNCYLYGENGYNNANTTSVTVGNTVRIKSTYTVVDGYYYPVFTLNSGKVKVENIQIELNSTATTYEPYQENKIDLLSTQTLNGINGVNDYIEVVDKGNGLYDLKKTQNIASVDLGTLEWRLRDASLVRFYSTTGFDKVKPTSETICKEYSYSQTWGNDKIAFSGIGGFGITDSSFAHKSQEEVKTALSGVYLYYQLKTPVVTTIATNLTYSQVSALRTNGGLLLVNDNNNQKYAQPNVTIKENYQYKN